MDYFNEIKNLIEKIEINEKVRYIESNKEKVETYYEIGKLLYKAQKGEKRARYGEELIKKWSKIFEKLYGTGYGLANLKNMRKFYVIFKKGYTVCSQFNLSWSHYKNLLKFDNENERNYYINLCTQNNLSVRNLQKMIKENSFNRLSYADKKNIKLVTNQKNNKISIKDMILDPIMINISDNDKLSEKALKKYILRELEYFFLQLGTGFTYVGNEYKIKIGDKNYFLDLLLFNYKLNCFVVVELKLDEIKHKDIGQTLFYTNLVDGLIKEDFHNKTIGIIVTRKNDKFILKYVSDMNIYLTTYKLKK